MAREIGGEHVCYECGRRFKNAPTRSAHVGWRLHMINIHGGRTVSSVCHAACDGIHAPEWNR